MQVSGSRSIRPARPDEAALLNELTLRSTMYWGYEPAFLDFEPEAITVDAAFMQRASVFVLEDDHVVVGYYAFVNLSGTLSLDKLFVEPAYIGSGCGRMLWNHAVDVARKTGASRFSLMSDPNAAPFYAAMGARFVREIPTGWPGWNLHEFQFELGTGSLPVHDSSHERCG